MLLLKKWLGTESNRRHTDFQSVALPTELPSHGILLILISLSLRVLFRSMFKDVVARRVASLFGEVALLA